MRNLRSSVQRRRELARINSVVNFGIAPKDPPATRDDVERQIFPYEGNCGDYAVTKRDRLLRSGWPRSALLLAEVIIRTNGEHHLVLLVRKRRVVLVLDNLSPVVTPLVEALDRYVIVRAESGTDPQRWTRDVAAF
ncbi:transglutaminase-like cysteine peptidase [Bradyrhizobium sp. 137]|nr:transglutaminase-like cysteine peptidase [Bradyrhizobium sp. 137]